MQKTYLQLQSFVVIVDDNKADASVLFVCDSERHHAQHLHVLQAAVTTTGQRNLLLYTQMYTAKEMHWNTAQKSGNTYWTINSLMWLLNQYQMAKCFCSTGSNW